jgi:hypothetical protein
MGTKRINLVLTAGMARNLDKLGAKIGIDRTNTMRYCIARTLEVEGIVVIPAAQVEPRK